MDDLVESGGKDIDSLIQSMAKEEFVGSAAMQKRIDLLKKGVQKNWLQKVKAGIGQHNVNTQYAHFGFNAMDTNIGAGLSTVMSANTHYAIPFTNSGGFGASQVAIGTGTNPDTSFTNSTEGHELVSKIWYIPDNITIDRVIWFSGADAATGDTLRCHLMSYDIDTGNGSTGGDLSNGVVLADGADITNAGYEQTYYQQMTIQSADVNAGKVLLFTWRQDSVNGDFSNKSNNQISFKVRE